MRVGCVRRSYEEFAWGADEVRPLSKTGVNNNGHVGMTLVDSLDTLLLMNMTAEYARAVEWIAKEFKLDSRDEVSVFEYSVHLLGGLLSAYEMAKERDPAGEGGGGGRLAAAGVRQDQRVPRGEGGGRD